MAGLTGTVGALAAAFDVSTICSVDWAVAYAESPTYGWVRKSGGGSLVTLKTGANADHASGGWYSYYDAQFTGGDPIADWGTEWKYVLWGDDAIITFPADTSERVVRIWFMCDYDGSGQAMHINAHLSDSSASDWVPSNVSVGGSAEHGYIEITYSAASAGQTLTVTLTDVNTGSVKNTGILAAGIVSVTPAGPEGLAGNATAGASAVGALTTDGTEFIGQASGTNTATLPAHQAGDLILAFAFRDGNTAAPTVPSGQGWSTLYNSTGANTCAHSVAWKIAAGSSEGVGTFTNATSVICHVYRAGVGRGLRVGASASGSGASTSVSYTGLTLQAGSGKSWVVGFAGHRSTNTSLETAPSGMVNRSNDVDATDEAAGHDTGGPVAAWSTTSVSVGGTSSGWRSHTIEVMSYAALAGDSVGGAAAEGTLTDASTPLDLAGAAVIAATASGSISTGVQLAGAAASAVLASGVLTIQIRLSGDALAGAVAAAGLSTAIQMAADAQAGAQASGTLDTGGTALAGHALAAAIVTGAITVQIRLNAAAVAGVIAQGVLTTGAGLNGTALASALATGNLATAIRLAAAALASVAASGALTDEIGGGGELPAVLAGDAQAGASAYGDLATGITMQAAAAIAAAAQGALSTQIRMAGAAISGALASGDITGAAQLAAAALATAVAQGDLVTAIRLAGAAQAATSAAGTLSSVPAGLAGNAQAIAIAEGGLTTSIRLAGAAASVVQATGSLDVGVTMQASAFASAMTAGVLLTQIRLDAAAVAGALSSGYLAGSVPNTAPAIRTIPVALESRSVPVAAEIRRVPA